MENTNTIQTQAFSFGHLALVLTVAATLLGFSWMKNPALFSFKKSSATEKVEVAYYPYVPPEESGSPQVAGISTTQSGPSLLNEDGSLSPVFDLGKVLGASTEQVSASTDGIKVKTAPDSQTNVFEYLKESEFVEGSLIDSAAFEIALSSNNQEEIDLQAKQFEAVVEGLRGMVVPASFAKLQKLKILQYSSAIQILKNYTNVDSNPEQAINDLGVFMQTQKMMGQELTDLNQKFNLFPN